jgi:hypothetical protein
MQTRHNKEILEVLIRTVKERAQLRAQTTTEGLSSELRPATKRKGDSQQRCQHTEEPPIKRIKVLDHDQSSTGFRAQEMYDQPNWLEFGNEWQHQVTLLGCNLTGLADPSLSLLLPSGSGIFSHQYDQSLDQSNCVEKNTMMPESKASREVNDLQNHTREVESSDVDHDLFIRLRRALGYGEDDPA